MAGDGAHVVAKVNCGVSEEEQRQFSEEKLETERILVR
jgi:hypothetical protein